MKRLKKIILSALVLILILGCFSGCKSNNNTNDNTSTITIEELGINRNDVYLDAKRILSKHKGGYLLIHTFTTSCDYDSTTDTCDVTIYGTVYPENNNTTSYGLTLQITYARSADGTWKRTDDTPNFQSYLP